MLVQKYAPKYDIKGEEIMKKPCVCIDSGHYKKFNRSPGIAEYYESEVMWKLHLLQKKYLEQLGIDVITTRADSNTDLELHLRGMKAKGCDLFISDHSNAVGSGMNENVDYVALFHLTNDTTTNADEISKEIADELAPIIAEMMGVKGGYKVLTKMSGGDRNGDGIMNDNYYGVLHGARLVNVPGIIIEHGFHTHSNTVRWLLNDANLDRLARAEAECIARKLIGRKVELEETKQEPKKEETKAEKSKFPYTVKVTASVLNVRAGAGTNYKVNTTVRKGEIFTIVAEEGTWGELKSGAGWISLKYTERF